MRLIDADDLKNALRKLNNSLIVKLYTWAEIEQIVDIAPTIDRLEVFPHAHWKWDGKSKDYSCSRCGYQGKMTLFCPDCGASMDGKEEPEITISCKLSDCAYNESGICSARRIDRDGMCFTQREENDDA